MEMLREKANISMKMGVAMKAKSLMIEPMDLGHSNQRMARL